MRRSVTRRFYAAASGPCKHHVSEALKTGRRLIMPDRPYRVQQSVPPATCGKQGGVALRPAQHVPRPAPEEDLRTAAQRAHRQTAQPGPSFLRSPDAIPALPPAVANAISVATRLG
jgi:hypothetical protein